MIKFTADYKSESCYPGAVFVNRHGVTATVLGRTLAKYSRIFVLEFQDGSIGTANYGTLGSGAFTHPIRFSRGNNTVNKYKTVFKRFEQILDRCNNPKAKDYGRYGAKGRKCLFSNIYEFYFELLACDKFKELLESPHLFDVDRIDNDGHYEPGNITISTKSENQRNKCNNFVYKLVDNNTNVTRFIGIKTDCEHWIRENLGVKTSIDFRYPKREIGKKNGHSVRHELL